MPFIADFKCEKCNHEYKDIFFRTFKDLKKKKNSLTCTIEGCFGKLTMVWNRAPSITVGENNDPESCKPSSYWRNAERVRQKKLEKNKEIEKEKNFYEKKGSGEKKLETG